MDTLAPQEIAAIRQRFVDGGCRVKDMTGQFKFEVVKDDFPAAIFVLPTSSFIQFSTFVFASPKNFLGRTRWIRDRFLNQANQAAGLVKFTCDEKKMDKSRQAWWILGMARFPMGVAEFDISAKGLENLVALWLQDVAQVMTMDADYQVTTTMRGKEDEA